MSKRKRPPHSLLLPHEKLALDYARAQALMGYRARPPDLTAVLVKIIDRLAKDTKDT